MTRTDTPTPSVARGNTYGTTLFERMKHAANAPNCKACGKPICDHKDAVYQGVVPAEGV